jgi:integrase
LRFRAGGRRHYIALGSETEGWSHARASIELQNILADVRRGIWSPNRPEPAPVVNAEPTFHEFASEWFEASKHQWRQNTVLDYAWQLTCHLLPFFKDHLLSEITIAEVDRYRQHKLAEANAVRAAVQTGKPLREKYKGTEGRTHERRRRPLSATSINKTITRLAQILEVAVEYGLIDRNPAKGRRRRLKGSSPPKIWLDRSEYIQALLDGASDLDRAASETGGHDHKGAPPYRRALLATLVFAGLRIGEATALCWRDVDLAGGRIIVRASKTDAGIRQVELLPTLRDELAAHKTRVQDAQPTALVFRTVAGTRLKQGNIRRRVLDPAVRRANEALVASGDVPLPDGVTPHKLRHTFASVLVALDVDPGTVMDQLGHANAAFTLAVYRHGMRRGTEAKQQLRMLVGHSEPAEADRERPSANPTRVVA